MNMKSFIFLLISMIAFNAFADYGRQGSSTSKAFGGGVKSDTLEVQFINVINQEGSALSAGQIVVWDISNDDGASVVIDTTRAANPACMIVKACAAAAICKCQTYGYTAALLFDLDNVAASANGRIYISGGNAGYVSARAPVSGDQIGSIKPIGFFYDAPTASGAVEAFIQLR
jgi:hypothetical protein